MMIRFHTRATCKKTAAVARSLQTRPLGIAPACPSTSRKFRFVSPPPARSRRRLEGYDLDNDLPITTSELDAIERLLGADLHDLLNS